MKVRAIRGAIQCSCDTDTEIARKTFVLLDSIVRENQISEEEIISIQFTQTEDLYSLNCAAGLRQYGYDNVPLFCAQEPKCADSLPRIIRVLLTCSIDETRGIKHIYLEGAKKLRPDIACP